MRQLTKAKRLPEYLMRNFSIVDDTMIGDDGTFIFFLHPIDLCAPHTNEPCFIHRPTRHHMREWPIEFDRQLGRFTRVCEHGVCHPDPDQIDFWVRTRQDHKIGHTCCPRACCVPEVRRSRWGG